MKLDKVYSLRRRVDRLEIVVMEPALLVCRVKESAACSSV
jgi:hypothetical protein